MRSIVSSGKDVGIGGEKRMLTILFTDIQGFTRRSETLSAEEVFEQLSSHFTALSRAIFDRGGTIDKFIGDSVMAFWNAPHPDPDHAANACYAVLRCKAVNDELNAEFIERGYEPMTNALRPSHRRSGRRQCRFRGPHAIHRAGRAGEHGVPDRGA